MNEPVGSCSIKATKQSIESRTGTETQATMNPLGIGDPSGMHSPNSNFCTSWRIVGSHQRSKTDNEPEIFTHTPVFIYMLRNIAISPGCRMIRVTVALSSKSLKSMGTCAPLSPPLLICALLKFSLATLNLSLHPQRGVQVALPLRFVRRKPCGPVIRLLCGLKLRCSRKSATRKMAVTQHIEAH